jgi:dihydrofolate reductase
MGKIIVFNFITLNGFFEGKGKDSSWHVHGQEENEFAVEMLNKGGTLLFGRVTYEMMAGYWTSDFALQNDPKVAEGMNRAEKIVFSRTLQKADWNNTRLIRDNILEELRKLKESGEEMAVLGSGSIVTQLAENNLIDEYQIMVDPVVLGEGTSIMQGISRKINLKLKDHRVFKSGVVLLIYEPLIINGVAT